MTLHVAVALIIIIVQHENELYPIYNLCVHLCVVCSHSLLVKTVLYEGLNDTPSISARFPGLFQCMQWCSFSPTHTHTDTQTHMCAHTYTHIHTHAYTHIGVGTGGGGGGGGLGEL